MKLLLASLIALTPVSASADDVIQWETTSKTCYRETYTEEYIPGTKDDPGYVRTYNELIEYPCNDDVATDRVLKRETVVEYDDNDCTDGKVAGAILGGGLGAAMSKGDGRWWAIPIGAVVGSKIGCDAAGG
mgnify:FL=1